MRFFLIAAIFACSIVSAQADDGDCGSKLAPIGVPFEIVAAAPSSSLVGKLSFGVKNAKVIGGEAVADLSVEILGRASSCLLAPRFPLGLHLHGVHFPLANPSKLKMMPETGIQDVKLDQELLDTSLKSILPLPAGFDYRSSLLSSASDFDGTIVAVDVASPSGLGVIVSGQWVIDRAQPCRTSVRAT